ncbi:hypothetical protein T459_24871 [Capsicum annuum]|uniref:Uncharacterized protein n=1 Tax=Capsicum annuum TaxID=4072 RepID=A0A2G2YJ44_CAPAN|nr:hypothetical protein T459_24871 [Capsicum annuum]
MDDVWDTNTWYVVKRSFPDDKNGSRVILTSWLANIGIYASSGSPHYMRCLSVEESLRLFNLKPCFLYMGAFPKDFEISVSRLFKLWIAAEYVRCKPEKDFEEVAEGYLSDLIGRSLIMVKKKTSSGKVKTCEVHDLLHDLILREVWKERSIYFAKSDVIVSPLVASFEHRIIFNFGVAPLTHIEHVYDISSLPRASSFLCFERDGTPGSCSQVDLFITFTNFKWLTVLDMCFQPFDHLPSEIWELSQLRKCCYFPNVQSEQEDYLLKLSDYNLVLTKLQILPYYPGKFSRSNLALTNWQTLRNHLGELSCPVLSLTKLQNLSYITFGSITRGIFEGMPNLRKLGIRESEEERLTAKQMSGKLKKLVLLEHLETLKCFFINPWVQQCDVFSPTVMG